MFIFAISLLHIKHKKTGSIKINVKILRKESLFYNLDRKATFLLYKSQNFSRILHAKKSNEPQEH